jgi:signal peptidase I
MELRLLIIGIIAFVYAKLSKYLKNKKVFTNKKIFMAWCAIFALLAGWMIYFLLNFMSKNGIEGGLGFGKIILIAMAALGYAGYDIYKAKRSDENGIEKIYAFNLDWAETVYFAAFFASVAMFFFMQAFKIPSASMRNTLLEGDNLFVNKIVYGIRLPFMKQKLVKFNDIKRGDIIVFKFPADSKDQINCGEPQYGRDFVKRVIGLPGETVEIKNKQIFINGILQPAQDYEVYGDYERRTINIPEDRREEYQKLWEDRNLEQYFGLYLRDDFGPVTIPEGNYLGIGDNRDFSCDSRFWGPIPERNIKGKAWFIHWPLNRIKIIK